MNVLHLVPSVSRQLLSMSLMLAAGLQQPVHASDVDISKFRRIEPQYIAALGDPGATSGNGAQSWGLWSQLARERSDHGFSGESRGGHARRERLPQAGLRGSHRRWAASHSLSGRTQGATARHVTTPTPERYFSTEWPERL